MFGTEAIDPNKTQNQFFLLIHKIITMQSVKFWLFAYVFAVGCYYFVNLPITVLAMVNTLLFPFAAILVGYFARLFMQYVPLLYRLLSPSYKPLFNFYSTFIAFVLIIIKLFIYSFIWYFSFVIGLFGLGLVIYYANKLVK